MMKHDFQTGMKRLRACYAKDLSPDEMDAYWTVLQDLDVADFHAAVVEIMSSDRQFMPRPGQIRKVAGVGNRAHGSWAQKAAGGADGDPDRPARIGLFLADAEKCGDVAREAYYRSMISHMDDRDRFRAEEACRAEREGVRQAPADHAKRALEQEGFDA